MTEKEFLETYDPGAYEKPSVTADILIFTVNREYQPELLLIKRGGHPYKDKWAIPGGFVEIDEAVEAAAARELMEETGLGNIYLEQLYTFGAVARDPRMRVISVAYMALVSQNKLCIKAGDDAAQARLFRIGIDNWELSFISADGLRLSAGDLAFDHEEMIRMGLNRLAGKLDYTNIGFEFLENSSCFTIYEFKRIYDGIKGKVSDLGNFRRTFKRRFIDEGIVSELDQTSTRFSKKEAKCYKYNYQQED